MEPGDWEEITPDETRKPGPMIHRVKYTAVKWCEGIQQLLPIRRFSPAMEMALKAGGDSTKKPLIEHVPKEYHDFLTTFEKKSSERLPEHQAWDHGIELNEDFKPRRSVNYSLTVQEQELLDEFLEENLRKGYIHPSHSPQASPFFFVGKKDGSLRPCQDYRWLNAGTKPDRYLLPLTSQLFEQLKGKQWFSKLDLRNGYNNVRIKEGDEWKAAFTTNRGLFEPTVMFFGLCNSPATFQRLMNNLFEREIREGWLVIYMDDMLIATDTMKEH